MPAPLIATLFTSTAFITFLKFLTIAFLVRIAIAVGVSVVVFTGFTALIDDFALQINTLIDSLGTPLPEVLTVLKIYGFYDAIQILLSGVIGIVTVKAGTGALKALRWS